MYMALVPNPSEDLFLIAMDFWSQRQLSNAGRTRAELQRMFYKLLKNNI